MDRRIEGAQVWHPQDSRAVAFGEGLARGRAVMAGVSDCQGFSPLRTVIG